MIKGFDGVRALAVIVVFFNHWTAFWRSNRTGDYGVWTFFTLSGFLIVRSLHRDRIRLEKGRVGQVGHMGVLRTQGAQDRGCDRAARLCVRCTKMLYAGVALA